MKTLFARKKLLFFIGIGGLVGVLLWIGMLPSLSLAAPSALPIRPTPFSATATPTSLPPTPTPFEYKRAVSESAGAFIKVRVQPAWPGLWTAVQWWDASETWHTIEGWQGTLDDDGTKTWWLPGTLFGHGPFRWLVYDKLGGDIIGTSEPFYLPHATNRVITVQIVLSEADRSCLVDNGRLLQYRSVPRE